MILALDIGNGSIKYARFAEGRRTDAGRLDLDAPLGELEGAESMAAVSVNPPVLARLKERFPRLLVVGEDLPLGIEVHYDPPEACGADRVMGVRAALHRRRQASAVLLLDAGTCLTATLGVRGEGVLGGAIAPGLDLMARALAEGTAALPQVEPVEPERFLGRSTEASIRSGLWAAFIGAAHELTARFRRECEQTAASGFEVVATGRGAAALGEALAEVDAVHRHATLWGVYLAAGGR